MNCEKKSSRRAFSLIELVGVLAVLAVLAASLVPVMLKRLDRAAWLAESSSLSSLADGLTQHILRRYNIPAPTTWAQALAAELNLAPTNISNTPRHYARAF